MKLIIDIPDKVYNEYREGVMSMENNCTIGNAVFDGKPYEERPQGEWIEIPVERDLLYNTGIRYTCSNCKQGNCYGKPPFCMYCGAKMRGGAE